MLVPSQNSKHVSDHFCPNDLFANQKRALEALKIPLKRELTEAVEVLMLPKVEIDDTKNSTFIVIIMIYILSKNNNLEYFHEKKNLEKKLVFELTCDKLIFKNTLLRKKMFMLDGMT